MKSGTTGRTLQRRNSFEGITPDMKRKITAAVIIPLSLALFWLFAPQSAGQGDTIVSRETATTTPVSVTRETPRRYATSTPLTSSQSAIKALVAAAFPDVPQMVKVVGCESAYRQFEGTSTPLLSPTDDVGVMQINQVHWAEAKALGLDIFNSVDDNIKMGRIVYEQQGLAAWTCKA